jgi:hypothetical protein
MSGKLDCGDQLRAKHGEGAGEWMGDQEISLVYVAKAIQFKNLEGMYAVVF